MVRVCYYRFLSGSIAFMIENTIWLRTGEMQQWWSTMVRDAMVKGAFLAMVFCHVWHSDSSPSSVFSLGTHIVSAIIFTVT